MRTKRRRCFWALATALILAGIALPALAVENRSAKSNVAAVNGSVITQEDFDREMGRVQRQLASMGKSIGDSQFSHIRKEILDSLIDRELLYQESQSKGIKVEEAAVNEQLNKLKQRFANEDQYKAALNKMKLSETDIKTEIKKALAIQQFIDGQFVQKVTVSDKEVKAYYDSHPDSFKQSEQARASHILIKVDPQADESKKAAARKEIKEIQQKVKKGDDFAALAKEYSQGPSSTKGGDLGYFRRGQMVGPFEKEAFALTPGQVSDIVETRFGYHLIKVTGKKPETTTAYADVEGKLQEYLKQKKVQEQLDVYVEGLKGKAKVERFMTETSK